MEDEGRTEIGIGGEIGVERVEWRWNCSCSWEWNIEWKGRRKKAREFESPCDLVEDKNEALMMKERLINTKTSSTLLQILGSVFLFPLPRAKPSIASIAFVSASTASLIDTCDGAAEGEQGKGVDKHEADNSGGCSGRR